MKSSPIAHKYSSGDTNQIPPIATVNKLDNKLFPLNKIALEGASSPGTDSCGGYHSFWVSTIENALLKEWRHLQRERESVPQLPQGEPLAK